MATISTSTNAEAGSGRFKIGIQISTALQRLDNCVNGGGIGYRAVLRRWELVRPGHAVVKMYDLIGCNCHEQTISHHELDPSASRSTDAFALFQSVPNLEQTTNALGVNGKNAARAIDGSDDCKLGHEDLQQVTIGDQNTPNVTSLLLAKSTNFESPPYRRRFARRVSSIKRYKIAVKTAIPSAGSMRQPQRRSIRSDRRRHSSKKDPDGPPDWHASHDAPAV